MVGAAIRGIGTGSGTDVGNVVTGMGKSGGESFGKIMSQSLTSNINSNVSQNVMKNNTSQNSTKSSAADASYDSSQKDKCDQITAKEDSSVSQMNADKNTKGSETVDEKLLKAAGKIKDLLKEKFGLSDEELEKIMSEMGLGVLDLLESANITDLVVNITGVEDAVAIITDSELSENLKGILEYLDKILTDLNANRAFAEETNVTELLSGQEGTENSAVLEKSAEESVQEEQSAKEDSIAETEMDSVEEVLKSKLSIENNTENTANSGKHENLTGNRQHSNVDNYAAVTGNLAQSVQDAFSHAMTSEVTQVNAADVIRQIVDAVKITNNQTLQSIEIQLNPENLGKINLTVSTRNGIITAEIATQSEQVRRAVESQMTMLKENLESQGIKVDAVEITVQSHAFESGQNLQGNTSEQEQAAKSAKRHLNLDSLEDLSEDDLSAEETTARNMIINENSSVEYTA